ncbi:phenylacetate-CoA ligase [Amycolatopsis bartoniae]|uniref:Phenylacetate-coenzyme A ligase n=1 Tax=Amycolatopsis bartoniae TaxID=941986 RepID=A0A8H9ITM0_9PSEU|nr:phenylacetate--CoA ligase [Amycolatopsis bartoniae]MBB2939667.1 phenylacetate-CoA ligase [Amycolatopsis bartoniae]TVT06227.1 phenylacetate--CoA ligase [Amycolatopsis bartoniae]GHF36654.1 phenylacetate-coenzyme A ligase [Amycolatopsis bartoniae]
MTSTATTERELWDEAAQTVPEPQLAKLAEEGLAREWERVWQQPIEFYKQRYESAGLSAGKVPSLDDIPRVTKNDFRADEAANPPWGTHRTVGLEDAIRLGRSTGTTGKPFYTFFTKHDLDEMLATRLRYLWRIGLRPGGRFAHSWPAGLYPSAVLGGRDYYDLDITEIPAGPPFTDDVAADHIELWRLLKPTGYMLTGSQLQTYDRVAVNLGYDLAEIMDGAILLLSEASCQFEVPRKRIENAYGVRLHNLSGASELPGFTSSDCRFHTGLHVSPSHHVVQVCDPETGREVAPGERGHLVVSAFGLDAFALRYDLEDIVSVSTEPCPCGETGPRYTFWGRGADAAVVAGKQILPIDVQLALEELGAPEFRVTPGETDTLQLRVESERDAKTIESTVSGVLGVPVSASTVEAGTFPRSSFKPRRIEA